MRGTNKRPNQLLEIFCHRAVNGFAYGGAWLQLMYQFRSSPSRADCPDPLVVGGYRQLQLLKTVADESDEVDDQTEREDAWIDWPVP